MAEVARRAGVVRATVYVHFPTREVLIAAVTERAMSEVVDVIVAAEPERGDPADALRRIVTDSWRTLGRYHALIAINTQLPAAELHQRHGKVFSALQTLIERGQRTGAFRKDVPAAWHLSMLVALTHAASAELRAERIPPDKVKSALVATVLGSLGFSP